MVSVFTLLLASFNKSSARCLLKEDFFIAETFSPPLIIGQVIVAFTLSSSFSSILELKSLLSVFEIFIDADGDNLDLSIFRSFIDIS